RGGGKDEISLPDDRARLEQRVGRLAGREMTVDVVVDGVDRERGGAAACKPVDAVLSRHVLHVVAEVIEECLYETASRFCSRFAYRGRRLFFLVRRLLRI